MSINTMANYFYEGHCPLAGSKNVVSKIDLSEKLIQKASATVASDQNLDSYTLNSIMNSDDAQKVIANDAEVKTIQNEIAVLKDTECELLDLEAMSKLPRGKRSAVYRHNRVFDRCRDRINNGLKLDLRLMQAGAASAIIGTAAIITSGIGFNPLSLIALGTTIFAAGIFSLELIPSLYMDPIVPGKAEKLMPEEIGNERKRLNAAIRETEIKLEKKKSEVMVRYMNEADKMSSGLNGEQSSTEISDGGDYVEIDGVKLDKRLKAISSEWKIFA